MDSFAELEPLRRKHACPRALRSLDTLFAATTAVVLAGALTACGGGAGGTAPVPPPPPPPPAPSPSPAPTAPIAAQLAVPTPVGYDADRLAAFNRLNEIRLAAGLGMVAQSTSMDRAAQAHADWMIANDSFTHEEVAGTVGFTGVSWPQRDEAFGYVPIEGAEVMIDPAHGAQGVDELVNSLYHRGGMLAFEPVDVGIGWSSQAAANISMPLIIDITRPGTDTSRGRGQAAQTGIGGVEIWPVDGARDVPLRLGLETPNPVPSQDVLTLGTPASLIVGETRAISVVTFTLTNSMSGVEMPVRILTSQNDPNLLMHTSFVAAIPLSVLGANTTYHVVFSGSAVDRLSGASEKIDRAWSFTTAAQ